MLASLHGGASAVACERDVFDEKGKRAGGAKEVDAPHTREFAVLYVRRVSICEVLARLPVEANVVIHTLVAQVLNVA